jgi:hypothetical protein
VAPTHQSPDPGFVHLSDVIETGHHCLQSSTGRGDEVGVIWPLGFLPPGVACDLPVPVSGVIAKDVAHSTPVEGGRRAADHVEIDVDGLGHGVAHVFDLTLPAQAGTMAERGVHGHRCWNLE